MSNKNLVRYEVITQEDEVTGDLMLPIPQKLLDELGWREGDEIEFAVNDQGRYVLKKANK
jgi:bifunctional DNA-binding transcriptional regulator/antitoxin component of YhaV-PrlF toxin-antitoxin module